MKTFDVNKPFCFRKDLDKPEAEREKLRLLATDLGNDWPIAVADSRGNVLCYNTSGENLYNMPDWHLVNIPQKRTLDVWVNKYPNDGMSIWVTKDMADKYSDADRIACLHIVREFEEGEGL